MSLLQFKTSQLLDGLITDAKVAAGAAIGESKLALAFSTTTLNNSITTVKDKKVLAYIEKTGISVGAVSQLDVTSSIIAASFYDTYNGSNTTTGVVTTAPNNKVFLRENGTNKPFEGAAGEDVYGRLTNAGVGAQTDIIFAVGSDLLSFGSKVQVYAGNGNPYYFWFNVGGAGSDPGGFGTPVEVFLPNGFDATQCANTFFSSINAINADFSYVYDSSTKVTLTSLSHGPVSPPTSEFPAEIVVNEIVAGVADSFLLSFYTGNDVSYPFAAPVTMDISFPESYNLHELPWNAFVNGLASSDTIGTLPTHGHTIGEITGLQTALDSKVATATLGATGGAGLVGVLASGWSNLATGSTTLDQVLNDIDSKIGGTVINFKVGDNLTSQVDDGTPDLFVVSQGSYIAESLEVMVNGSTQIRGLGFTETNPATGQWSVVTSGSISGTDKVASNYRY